MKKTFIKGIMMMLVGGMTMASCSSDDDDIAVIPVTTVTLEIPANLENAVLSNASAKLTNVQTQREYTIGSDKFVKNGNTYQLNLGDLEEGTYNVAMRGHLDFT